MSSILELETINNLEIPEKKVNTVFNTILKTGASIDDNLNDKANSLLTHVEHTKQRNDILFMIYMILGIICLILIIYENSLSKCDKQKTVTQIRKVVFTLWNYTLITSIIIDLGFKLF